MNGQHTWLSGVECFIYAKKAKAVFNENCKNTVFRLPTVQKTFHPTPKPIKLMERLVRASTNKGDTILDPFMGSGTTGVACANLERNFIGIELDKEYFEIASNRIEKHIKWLEVINKRRE
jgi:site-specific DNA-methyltransferase (adenine-specific)